MTAAAHTVEHRRLTQRTLSNRFASSVKRGLIHEEECIHQQEKLRKDIKQG
jgi:hypothetical protein